MVPKSIYGDELTVRPSGHQQDGLLSTLLDSVPILGHDEANGTVEQTQIPEQSSSLNQDGGSMGDVVFNVHHFTQCQYNGDQVYIYSPKKNDENHDDPQKWAFYYVPVLQPVKVAADSPWVWLHKNEIRIRLAFGNQELEKLVRKAVIDQHDNQTIEAFSHRWVIAPLMMDSLSAYIVGISSSLVDGVAPFHMDNPIANVMTFRFACTSNDIAREIERNLLEGDYDIDVSFYFAGMHQVKTNMVTITAKQLQSVMSKTIADGDGTSPTYIHRDQASSFVSQYMANVKKLIYIEDPNANMTLLTNGLEEQFRALFQEGIDNSKAVQIEANVFGQVWQSSDLNPDRITSEMSKMFTFNQSETMKDGSKMNYYNINERKDSSLSVHAALDVRVKTVFTKVDVSAKVDYDKKDSEEYHSTSHSLVSETDIKKAASQASIEGAWEGEKFVPKSFKVFKLSDTVNRLQVAIISKQLLAEKKNGAVTRKVSASTAAIGSMGPLTGEIKLYAGISSPVYPWLVCDGSIVLRSQFPHLFAIIGTKYGEGNDSTTFKLPDLRGRVPIGLDDEQLRLDHATEIGSTGGNATHQLAIEELPIHAHDHGSLTNSYDGTHTHGIHDPGHTHGGQTTKYPVPSSYTNEYGTYNYQTTGYREWEALSISTAYTHISVYSNGNHTHSLTGDTGLVGQDKPFAIVPPFQTFRYIIYAGE